MPTYHLTLNGETRSVEAPAEMPLLWLLRDRLHLTGTKYGCGAGVCGACTVHIDGKAERACIAPMGDLDGAVITTIEGLAEDGNSAVQAAWQAEDVPQCGYCQVGQIMQATKLLEASPRPSDAEIDQAMGHNICRCGSYQRIRAAIHRAAEDAGRWAAALPEGDAGLAGSLLAGAALAGVVAGRAQGPGGCGSRDDLPSAGSRRAGNGQDGSAGGPGSTLLSRRSVLKGAAAFQLALVLRGLDRWAPEIVNASAGAPGGVAGDQSGAADPVTLSVWVAIAADERVTLTVHKSEMGQGVRTSLAMIVAEELDADWSQVQIVQAPADRAFGSQATVGSSSVSGSWNSLRAVGATGRAMLVEAAARRWGVAAASCTTEPGAVLHPASGRRLSYGTLAADAAKLPVPPAQQVPLKDPASFRLIGQATSRVDNADVVTGRAVYGMDVRLPGMLHAVVARCPIFGGRLGSVDDSAARAIPGVRQVVRIPTGVAVVGETTWHALQGRDALRITWDEGPNADLDDAGVQSALAGAIRPFPELPAGAARVAEASYRVPYLAHATMEPMNCVADVGAERCTVWAPTQSPGGVQQSVASMTGLPQSAVRVEVTLMGGGFGRRANTDYASEAAAISRAVGAPVQLTWTREDDMRHDYYRPASRHDLRGALDASGRIVAWQHHAAMAGGGGNPNQARPPYSFNTSNDIGSARLPVPTGAWRSVSHSQIVFANESFVDELAALAGQDPLAYRLANLTNGRLRGVLEAAAERAAWGAALPAGQGRGIACVSAFGSLAAVVAELAVAADGLVRLHRVVAAVDCGTAINPGTVEAQIQGAIVDGLSTALMAEITIEGGRVVQENFFDYRWFRMGDMPRIEVHIMPSRQQPGGIGEVGYPATPPAVANAIFAATGKRLRRLPIRPEDLAGSVPATPTAAPPSPTTPPPTVPPTVEPTPTGVAPAGSKVYLPNVSKGASGAG